MNNFIEVTEITLEEKGKASLTDSINYINFGDIVQLKSHTNKDQHMNLKDRRTPRVFWIW